MRRAEDPRDDLISQLVHEQHDGAPIESSIALGIAALVLIARSSALFGGSAWESNPPATAERPYNGFEDRAIHRNSRTPSSLCSHSIASARQVRKPSTRGGTIAP